MTVIYTLAQCDTCRRATAWLRDRGAAFEERAIRETPPSPAELRRALALAGDRRKLCNTSGRDYRALGIGEKLAGLSDDGFIALLAGNGNLVKRPFLVHGDTCLAGFQEAAWAQLPNLVRPR